MRPGGVQSWDWVGVESGLFEPVVYRNIRPGGCIIQTEPDGVQSRLCDPVQLYKLGTLFEPGGLQSRFMRTGVVWTRLLASDGLQSDLHMYHSDLLNQVVYSSDD